MMNNLFTPTKNQAAILDTLAADGGLLGAQEIVRANDLGPTSVYASLRVLKERGVVIEKQTKVGNTPKGDRFAYRLSAKGKKLITA